ncbi:hypothetical protein A3Q29_20190 [Providencia stuartii]|uniref:Transposase n=2 Tax=Providencia TaxID=586 RepID=A0A1S1HN72_PROST|nr:hypothetical protein A3Q29_20190 [Providencia stuartii]
MPSTRNSRIQILTSDEIDELYRRPEFNQTEREEFFSLDTRALEHIRKMEKLESRVHFILIMGYFRSKPVIPQFHLKDVRQDVRYICHTYFAGAKPQYTVLPKSTRFRLVSQVISFLGFEQLTPRISELLVTRLQDVATIYNNPRYIFDECLTFFGQQRIALPAYTSLQDFVTQAMSSERQRTEQILSQNISKKAVRTLQSIMADKGLLNSLAGYQGSARGFSPSELDRELQTHQTIKVLYPELKRLLDALSLSRGNMLYYASLVKHRSVYKLRRSPKWQGRLYLICYLFFRYRENNDKLVTAFSYLVNKHNQAAKAFAQQKMAEELEVIRGKLKDAGSILRLFVDDSLDDATPFGEIRKQAFSFIDSDDIRKISRHLHQKDFDLANYQWQYADEQARKMANSLRKLFISIDIECDAGQSLLAEQITLAKAELTQQRTIKTITRELISLRDQTYLIDEEDEVNPRRFEIYLYQKMVRMLEQGRIFVSESEQNKRLEDDLIPIDIWSREKQDLIEKTGLERLHKPITQTLKELEGNLNNLLTRVTANINADANDFVKCQPRTNRLTWSLANRRWKSSIDNPVYNQLRHMGIIEIMDYVNRKTGYLDAFEGLSSQKRNSEAREGDLIACLFGNGANYGLHKIASVSDRSVGALRSVNDSYIRSETIHSANDTISNAIARLPIFKYYTINETAPFGSIDGQKHACRINTFKARFSAKYFRKGKGVSAMTLVVNHVPVNTTINALNEYEGHFAFDLLYNNSSDIQPGSVATDNHGINNVNFALLDIFGYQFSPRYARFKRVFEEMFDVTLGEELHITLKKPIKYQLIVDEWEYIQHIICSLSRKATNQSTVVKKLSSNKRSSRTLAALREYDRLIKSLYVLEYVDSQTLRQFVQHALNRGEAYHQLRRAIASVNGNQFRGGNDYEVELWNDCAR